MGDFVDVRSIGERWHGTRTDRPTRAWNGTPKSPGNTKASRCVGARSRRDQMLGPAPQRLASRALLRFKNLVETHGTPAPPANGALHAGR